MKVHRRQTQGTILISIVVVLLIVSMGCLAVTLTLQDYGQLEKRGRWDLQALYAAEAGALEVVSWFNTSGTVVSDGSLAPLFQRDGDDVYANLDAQFAAMAEGEPITIPESLRPSLHGTTSREVGRVISLEILKPTAAQKATIPFLLCVVKSEGRNVIQGKTGPALAGRKKVELFIAYHRLRIDGTPGVILSRDVAAFGGSMSAHWGDVYAHESIMLPNESQMLTQSQDPWLKFRSELKIVFGSTWKVSKWGVPYQSYTNPGDPLVTGDIVNNTNQPAAGVAYGSVGTNYGSMLYQNQVLKWPNYDYQALKDLAKKKGRYFGTDSAGNLYRDGVKDAAHRVTDLTALNVSGSRSDWGNVDYDVVFVDSTDGNPPLADGSNLINMHLSGSGYSWKGFYYLCANLDISGLGTPSAIPCVDPGNTAHNLNIFMDGLLLVKGNLNKGSGNNQLYGSVYAEKGYIGTGTVDVYYNIKLKDGFPFPINNRVDLVLWKVES